MKKLLGLWMLVCAVSALGAQDEWTWTAPEPPLPNTWHWDYGWDSTSNGVPPEHLTGPMAMLATVATKPKPPMPPMPEGAMAAPAPVKLTEPPTSTGLYLDAGLGWRTKDFSNGEEGYFLGVGYQVTKHWGAELRVNHEGLDVSGSVVEGIGGRLVARMPFSYLAPYTFLGGRFDLKPDEWRIQPGAGIEIGLSRQLEGGPRLFFEGGLDADLKGANGYLFGGGIRLRF